MTKHDRLYNTPEDCRWLRETALRGYEGTVPPFRSFTIAGHEDCPLEIAFYAASDDPDMADPSITWELIDAGLHNNLSHYMPRKEA